SVPFKIEENGTTLLNKYLNSHGEYSYGTLNNSTFSFTGTFPEDRSLLKFTYSPPDFAATGYLNYYEISYQRDLKYSAEKLILYSNPSGGISEYQLSNFGSTNIRVFNISDFSNVKEISDPILLSASNFTFQANETPNFISKYFACVESDIKTPVNPTEIKNQDIRGADGKAKFIIISPKDFMEQANRLKNYRETESKVKISTSVIDVDDIFSEFSCGMKDPSAIRDFLRYAYYNWSVKPEYVLLFGDGDYDYKNIEGGSGNFVIPFETEEFLLEIYSYASDDYYAAIIGNDNQPDLAIARLPVRSLSEAKNVINKVIHYETNSERGPWRNLITLVADDGKTSKGDDGTLHTGQSETLANSIIPNSYDLKKIYLAGYPTIITGLGRRKPEV
ncbi:MAG: C25 family cysteine peptidase, partial [Ignavibacteria bacterium]|nr:C25 family cysteine peptidase [Ignavibacteria bacterium]